METEKFSDIVNRILFNVAPQSARWRYFTRDGSQDRYFYTVAKINHHGKPRYVAGIYRYMKTARQWKMIKSAGFAKKYRAKAAALSYRDKEIALIEGGYKRP